MARTRRTVAVASPGEPAETDFELQGVEDAELREALEAAREGGDYALLADDRFSDWTWTVFRVKSPQERNQNPGAPLRVWLEKILGPLEVAAIRDRWGPGVYEFRGYWGGHLRARLQQELGAVREAVRAAAPAPPEPSALERRVDELAGLVKQLVERQAAPAPAPAPALGMDQVLDTAMRIAEMSRGSRQSQLDPTAIMGLWREGMEFGREVARAGEPAEEGSTVDKIMDRALPLAERLLAGMFAPRAAAPRPAPPPATVVTDSGATVVEAQPPAVPAPEAVVDQHRMATAVEVFARGITEHTDAAEIADTLDEILSDDELATVVQAPTGMLLERMRAFGAAAHPALMTDDAEPLLAAVQAELRRPPE